jgi:hypothetical protein
MKDNLLVDTARLSTLGLLSNQLLKVKWITLSNPSPMVFFCDFLVLWRALGKDPMFSPSGFSQVKQLTLLYKNLYSLSTILPVADPIAPGISDTFPYSELHFPHDSHLASRLLQMRYALHRWDHDSLS